MSDLSQIIKSLPLTPGVYLMKNAKGKVIYVGKAVSLRKRVQSYFRRGTALDPKTAALVNDIAGIDHIVTASEAEALILEASLIKRYRPQYNVLLLDDKTYPLIEITGDKYPRVSIVRPRVKKKTSRYFGPYVNSRLIREALSYLRRVFPFCTCSPMPKKPCLDYHIGLCPAPCVEAVSQREYKKNIRNIRLILEGKKDELIKKLHRDMESLSRKKKFEKAAEVRDQIRALGALFSGTKDINYFKEAEQLQRVLGLPRRPQRIEAFDISNIMGAQSVGSMVSFLNGAPDKNHYRRFRIKDVEGIDDFRMIAEVVRRRYSRLKKEGAFFPDLIVIDGGKGQLKAACQELALLQVEIPIMSLAKREEEIFVPGRRSPVVLPRESLGLRLLQRIRDEAHRFAVTYHRKLRSKKFME